MLGTFFSRLFITLFFFLLCVCGGGGIPYILFQLLAFVTCSHEEIDVSHPEFFSAAKLNAYVPPNKEVLVYWCLFGRSYVIV